MKAADSAARSKSATCSALWFADDGQLICKFDVVDVLLEALDGAAAQLAARGPPSKALFDELGTQMRSHASTSRGKLREFCVHVVSSPDVRVGLRLC